MICTRAIPPIVLCATLLTLPSDATTLAAFSTRDLVRLSRVVAVADVVSLKTVRAGGLFSTVALLQVDVPIAGAQSGDLLTVRIPGGSGEHLVQRVEGAPRLAKGDRLLVFLEPAGERIYRFVGLEQGALRVEPDSLEPGRWIVRRSAAARLVQRGTDGLLHQAVPPPATEPLGPYLNQLRVLVEQSH